MSRDRVNHDVVKETVISTGPAFCCLLQGAEQVLLDGVFHSMSQIGSYSKAGDHVWYGDERVVDTWLPHLVSL